MTTKSKSPAAQIETDAAVASTDSPLVTKMKAIAAREIERFRQRQEQSLLPLSLPLSKPEHPPPSAQLIEFPPWPDDRRATAQAVFRSALFPAMNFSEGRSFFKEKKLVSVEGVEVIFTGEQLDQSDLDVYLELLKIAHQSPFGAECRFSAYSLLKALGRQAGNKDYKWLHSVIVRLRSGTVEMTDHRVRYFGGLIDGGTQEEDSRHYNIKINTDFACFFNAGLWASLDNQQRCALGRNQTAKALHAYYSTHAAPGLHTFEKLAGLVGLKNKKRRDMRANLIKAHDELKRIGFLSDYEVRENTIKPMINHTAGQNRHLVQKSAKARRNRRPKDTG